MHRFWKRVHRQAWGDARQYVRTRLGYAVFLLVTFAAAVLGVRFFGTPDGWIDEIVGGLIWVSILIVVFVCIYGRNVIRIAPHMYERMAERWRKAQARVRSLENKIEALSATQPIAAIRDVSVADAIAYICFGSWGRSFYDAANSPEVSSTLEVRQFHQAAADGDVPAWGRTSKNRPYEQIDRAFWLTNQIEWFSLLKDEPHSESIINSKDINEVRYVDIMTNRSATETLFRSQPPEIVEAKALWAKLRKLLDEGMAERSKLLPVLPDFDAAYSERILSAWDERVLAAIESTCVRQTTRSRYKTLDTWVGTDGAAGRSPEQVDIERTWSKKLQILNTITHELEDH